jgi:hypothetical protein
MSVSILFLIVALLHSVYYITTCIWPLVNIESFMKVTGPKTDTWLVKTVASLLTAIGVVILYAGIRQQPSAEVFLLGIGSAFALLAIDVVYVAKGRIAPIYLGDGAAELLLIVLWITTWVWSGTPLF